MGMSALPEHHRAMTGTMSRVRAYALAVLAGSIAIASHAETVRKSSMGRVVLPAQQRYGAETTILKVTVPQGKWKAFVETTVGNSGKVDVIRCSIRQESPRGQTTREELYSSQVGKAADGTNLAVTFSTLTDVGEVGRKSTIVLSCRHDTNGIAGLYVDGASVVLRNDLHVVGIVAPDKKAGSGTCSPIVKQLQRQGEVGAWWYRFSCHCSGIEGGFVLPLGPFANDQGAIEDAFDKCSSNCEISCGNK